MKSFIILFLTTVLVAQTPAPKNGKEADAALLQLRQQHEALREKLMKNPDYVKFLQLQDNIDMMQIRVRALHMQDDEAASLAQYKAKQAAPKD